MRCVFIFILAAALTLAGCKSSQKITDKHQDSNRLEELITNTELRDCQSKYMSMKTKVFFETPELKDNFKLHFRIVRDSVIWVSATYYRVEVARALITRDTVKIMDRKGQKYYVGDFDYFKTEFNVDASYEMIEDLLLCNLGQNMRGRDLKFAQDDENYIIGQVNKRKLKRTLNNEANSKKEVYFGLWIGKDNYKVNQVLINNDPENRKMVVKYDNYQEVGTCQIPHKIKCTLEGEKNLDLEFNYLKIEEEESFSLPFRIPDKYERQL